MRSLFSACLNTLQLWGSSCHPLLHRHLSRRFPEGLWHGSKDQRKVALTFDDGPHPEDTLPLLDVLSRHRVHATFFWLGQNILSHPELVNAIFAAGHQLAIHGFVHRVFPTLPHPILKEHLDRTRILIEHQVSTGRRRVIDVRPPFGLFTRATLHQLISWQYRPVMWSVVPLHWLQSEKHTLDEVARQTTSGAIIVLHEGQKEGPSVASLAGKIISLLTMSEYEFVTVEQLATQ